jgi:hypothetical protein
MVYYSHWHWLKPPPGSAPVELPPRILDPETPQQRQLIETNRRAQIRAHRRVRQAQAGRILSQHEQLQSILRHCSACIVYGHDETTCQGCRSTDHIRNACSHVPCQGLGRGTQLHQPPLQNRLVQCSRMLSFWPLPPSQSRPDTPGAFGGTQMSQNPIQNRGVLMPEDDWIPQT